MIRWNGGPFVVANVASVGVWLAAVYSAWRAPKSSFAQEGRGKVVWLIIILTIGAGLKGIYVPLGALAWHVVGRRPDGPMRAQ